MRNFKKIILHSLLLLVFVGILLVMSMAPYFYGEAYYYQDYKVRKSLSGQLDTLIVGSSHALRSVKPTVLNKELGVKSYNLSSPVMSMYGRYVLLEKEIKRNPIKTVYMELSYNVMTLNRENAGIEGDLYILGRLDNLVERIKFSNETFTKSEYEKIFTDSIQRSKYAIENLGEDVIVQDETYGYLPLTSNNYSLTLEEKKAVLNTASLDTTIKKENLEYFEKIMNLCKKNDIKVVLIVTPVIEKMILKYINMDEIFSQYRELGIKYNCEYYDFNLDKKRADLYSEENSFFDGAHMSDEGAEIFSKRLSEIITKVKNNEDVSNEFYDTYEEIKKTIIAN